MNDHVPHLPSSKLCALGLLASGIAHDFNNLLSIVEGYAYILQQRVGNTPALQDKISAILNAAYRGNELTQLIAEFTAMEDENPAELIATIHKSKPILRALLSSRIEIEFQIPSIQVVVVENEGMIIEWMILMAAEIARNITGAGKILVSSEIDAENATLFFTNYDTGDHTERHFTRHAVSSNLQNKTILVVDDEEALLPVLEHQLENLGMKVLKAANADTALLLQKNYPDAIDFLLTDIVMPDVDGVQLAEMISDHRPRMGVIYMTGYDKTNLPQESLILPKPLKPENLSQILQKALEKVTDA